MKVKHRILLFAVGGYLCIFSNILQAQSQPLITLQEALNYALANKAEAKKAQLKIQNGQYQIDEARARALPQVSASGGINYNPIIQESALPGDIFGQPGKTIMVPYGQTWNSSAGISLRQNLFDQQVFIGLKAAKSTQEFYRINADLTDEQIIERVATAYYQVFVQKQKLETIENSYKSTLKVKEIIQSLYENGLAKKIDLDRTKVKLTNINTLKQQLINAVELQENALKFYMGMSIYTSIQLANEDLKMENILLEDQVNTEVRTEIKLLQKQKQLLDYNKAAVKSTYYPTLGLTGNYAWQGLGSKFPIGTTEKQGTFWTDYASIGLMLNIPIFSGNGIKAKVNQAQIELDILEQDIKDTKLGLELEYVNSKTQIENSLIAIHDQEQNVSLAQTVLENTKNNYQYGLATLTELLDAENAWVEAKNNYSNSLLDLKLAEIQLIKSRGELKKLVNK